MNTVWLYWGPRPDSQACQNTVLKEQKVTWDREAGRQGTDECDDFVCKCGELHVQYLNSSNEVCGAADEVVPHGCSLIPLHFHLQTKRRRTLWYAAAEIRCTVMREKRERLFMPFSINVPRQIRREALIKTGLREGHLFPLKKLFLFLWANSTALR